MKRKNRVIWLLMSTIILGIFIHFEYKLYFQYQKESKIRNLNKIKITSEIIEKFTIRKEEFYNNKKYLKYYNNLKFSIEKEKGVE